MRTCAVRAWVVGRLSLLALAASLHACLSTGICLVAQVIPSLNDVGGGGPDLVVPL